MTSGAAGADDAVAPMTGTVTAVQATAGAEVKKGQIFFHRCFSQRTLSFEWINSGDLLMTIVAMKMEHAIYLNRTAQAKKLRGRG